MARLPPLPPERGIPRAAKPRAANVRFADYLA